MRVVAGKYKGRILHSVRDNSVRPATSKVKAAIFNILQSRVEWSSVDVLDLYAGSGSVGIEALSRGASRVFFVEKDRNALKFLKSNIESIGALQDAHIIAGDVLRFIEGSTKTYDIIFCDPPYSVEYLAQLPSMLFTHKMVSHDGIVIMEHPTGFRFDASPDWNIFIEKQYGRTSLSFFHHQRKL